MSLGDLGRCIGACSLTLVLGACAFGTETLRMPNAGMLTTGVFGGRQRHVTVIAPFTDSRTIRHRCGMKKNSYNIDTADLVCSESPDRWLADLLAEELRKAGFEVAVQASGSEAQGLRVEGTLRRLFTEPLIGFITVSDDTEMHVELRATTSSGLVATRSFFARTSRSSVIATLDLAQSSLDEATQRMVHDLVAAIVELMNRYPELS